MIEIWAKNNNGPHGWEHLETCDTQAEATALLNEYTIAFGPGWTYELRNLS